MPPGMHKQSGPNSAISRWKLNLENLQIYISAFLPTMILSKFVEFKFMEQLVVWKW